MMTVHELERALVEVEAEIARATLAEFGESGSSPIIDGPVDLPRYVSASSRILWILKEPYDDFDESGNPCGGGWSLTRECPGMPEPLIPKLIRLKQIGTNGVYSNMAYITYSVFNGCPAWEVLCDNAKRDAVAESLRSIAYINVSKVPGRTTSNWGSINGAYQKNRCILKRQIEILDPHVVIGGATLPLFFEDFGLRDEEFPEVGYGRWCKKGGRLWITTNHPGARFSKAEQELYVTEIARAIRANC